VEFTLPDRSVSEDVLVSLLIPAYRATYFKEALQSALEQSWKHLEIIVCDDSGGSEIEAICTEIGGDDPRLRYERNPEHLGALETCKRLSSLSTGAYIKYLSDDDVLHCECVERLARCLQAYPWVTLAASYRQVVDSAGEALLRRGTNSRLVFEDSIVDGLSAINLLLETQSNFIGGPSAGLFRRMDVEDLNNPMSFRGVDGDPLGDLALWMQLLSKGEMVYLVQAMSEYRQHPDQKHRQADFEDRAYAGWAQLNLVGRQMGFLAEGAPLDLKVRPLATRPWWSNVIVRIYRDASELVNEKGLAEASEALLKLAALLPDEPWPPVVLAESLLSADSPEKALQVMSPTLSSHRDYFPAYALAGSALASLGKGEDAAAVFAEGCVWALPMFSTGDMATGISEPFELNSPRSLWIQTGRFHFAISFKLVITVVPAKASLPIRVPVYLNGDLVSECAFYGSGDSSVVTLETHKDRQNAVIRLGPTLDTTGDEEAGIRIRLQDFRVVLIGKLT
jgi:glycosyltransferase involved in cell wall biosynthesis